MSDVAEAERRGWVRGYRAALDDMEALGRAQITAWYTGLVQQLAADLREIDSVGARRATLARLREAQHGEGQKTAPAARSAGRP